MWRNGSSLKCWVLHTEPLTSHVHISNQTETQSNNVLLSSGPLPISTATAHIVSMAHEVGTLINIESFGNNINLGGLYAPMRLPLEIIFLEVGLFAG